MTATSQESPVRPIPSAGEKSERLRGRERLALGTRLAWQKLAEYARFDSFAGRKLGAVAGLLGGALLRVCGKQTKALSLWSAVHRSNGSALVDRIVEHRLRSIIARARKQGSSVFEEYVGGLSSAPWTARFFEDPTRLLGKRLLVLKSPRADEKGVLVLSYAFTFPLIARAFDLHEVGKRYHLVLQPSWSGLCDLDVLCFTTYDFPVFVQAYEPRDADFLRRIHSNLIPVPVSSNWWVDHRVFRPLPGATKEVDFIMVASWAPFKRHHRLFAALARFRSAGERLRGVLVGYRSAYSLDDIHRQARYHGVADQLELYERLTPEEVNVQYNRAKVNVLWSRREGVNKAIIEGMLAGVPCVVREGFNYGHRYAYVNDQTGCFAGERDLPSVLLRMARDHERFAPRDWVMRNMTCQHAARILGETIRQTVGETGQEELAVPVSFLDTMRYWDENDRERFESDYDFLRSTLRK